MSGLTESIFTMAQPLETVIGGKYEILQKIGEGGMGSIYKVRHRLLDEVRIVKVLRSQLAMDETLQQRFQNEAKIAIRLRHPNIAHLYDFSVSDEGRVAFIVMEFIDGVTLQEMIAQSGAPTLGLAVEIGVQFSKALSYLHSQGFVHRDIASDNLMLTTDFEGSPLIKLIDLGIAKGPEQDANLTATGIFMGKARYSPPEMFNSDGGASTLDERSDVYSFGVLLYELLTGKCPFPGDNFSEIVAGHLFREPRPFDETDPDGNVPEDLRGLTLSALEKEPEKRPSSIAEIGERLAQHAVPIDQHRSEFVRALEATSHLPTMEAEPAGDGSTQNRLDREFGVGDPSSHDDETRAVRLEAVSQAALAIRERTEHGEVTSAKKDLELAVSLYGDHPEFEDLRERLARASAAPRRRGTQATAGADFRTPHLRSHQTPIERLTSPVGLALVALALLLVAGGLWLVSRPDPPAAHPADPGAGSQVAALFVQSTPRWRSAAPLDSSEPSPADSPAAEEPPPFESGPPTSTRRPAPAERSRPTPPPAQKPIATVDPAAEAPLPSPAPPVTSAAEPAHPERGQLYGPDPGVIPPSLISLPQIAYPTGFKAPKDDIYLMVEVLVGEDGRVITAKIAARESAKRRFKELAVDEAKKATFRPATKNGVVGKMWATIRVPLPGE